MKKAKLFFIFLLLISVSFASAANLGISPAKIILLGNQNEILCKNFSIFGDDQSIFHGEIKWSKKDSRQISDYIYDSKELEINSTFPVSIKAGTYQLCTSSKNSGNYYGALIYKLENSSYAIGNWIELDTKSKNSFSEMLSLTGNVINDSGFVGKFFIFSLFILLIILFLLLRKLKKV